MAAHWVVIDSFLEFLGTFPLGLLVFLIIGFVVVVCLGCVINWIVCKITGKTEKELFYDPKTGKRYKVKPFSN